jgi:hypothetical protein
MVPVYDRVRERGVTRYMCSSCFCSCADNYDTRLSIPRGTFGVHGFEEVQQQNLYHIEPLNRDNTEVR